MADTEALAHRQLEVVAGSRMMMEAAQLQSLADQSLRSALAQQPARAVDVPVLLQPSAAALPPFCEPSILCEFL